MSHSHVNVCDAQSHNLFLHSAEMDGPTLLTELMKKAGENAYAVATSLKKPSLQSYIWKFTNGVAKEPRRSSLQPLADRYAVPIEAFYDPKIADQVAAERGLLPATPSPAITQQPRATRPEADRLVDALDTLTESLLKADEDARISLEPLLASLAREPEKAKTKSRFIVKLLVTNYDNRPEAHDERPGRISGDLGVLDLGGNQDGRSNRTAASGGSKR